METTCEQKLTGRTVVRAWKNLFGNARLIRQAADQLLGLPVTPNGAQRSWAAWYDIDDPQTYAQAMLEAAYASDNFVAHTGGRLVRTPGTRQLNGGVCPLRLRRGIILPAKEADWQRFCATHQTGETVQFSLAAATPKRAIATRLAGEKTLNWDRPTPGAWMSVLYEIEPGATGVEVAVDEFVLTGNYLVTDVRGNMMRPVNLAPGYYGVHVALKPLGRIPWDGGH